MKGPPYLVGRLLSLADQLHVQYCLSRSEGADSSLNSSATCLCRPHSEQPTKALAILSQRIVPYQAWAQTVQGG